MRMTCKGHVISSQRSSRLSPGRRQERESLLSILEQEPIYTLKCNSLTKTDIVCMTFIMPNTGKQTFSTYEQPGRVAAFSNLNYEKIKEAINSEKLVKVQAFSEEGFYDQRPPIGEVEISCQFIEDPVVDIKEDHWQ